MIHYFAAGSRINDDAVEHEHDAIAHFSYNGKIVSNKQDSKTVAFLHAIQQREHLCLNRDI